MSLTYVVCVPPYLLRTAPLARATGTRGQASLPSCGVQWAVCV